MKLFKIESESINSIGISGSGSCMHITYVGPGASQKIQGSFTSYRSGKSRDGKPLPAFRFFDNSAQNELVLVGNDLKQALKALHDSRLLSDNVYYNMLNHREFSGSSANPKSVLNEEGFQSNNTNKLEPGNTSSGSDSDSDPGGEESPLGLGEDGSLENKPTLNEGGKALLSHSIEQRIK